ncbi:hypothetical protein FRUB_10244 [Fimbriiglobus ruber]|uniref:Uncharacterized protein n=1 Tax=Fimbriiglobus ruber TaxID=1908690 RepID=A0A225D012_9BACT|nr:hypothetical protein FRUB_10244 [Fimbriiglobus ruber]
MIKWPAPLAARSTETRRLSRRTSSSRAPMLWNSGSLWWTPQG